jgi:hypothetical protein
MYLSLNNLAKKYDLHPDTIRRKKLIQGVHYIKIGKLIRYDIKAMHELLVTVPKTDTTNDVMSNFLIDI